MYGLSLDLRRSDWMSLSIPLLIVFVGSRTPVTCLPEIRNHTDLHLDCAIDWNGLISCAFESQNCPEHSLTLESEHEGVKQCVPTQCPPPRAHCCCCSIPILAILLEYHTISVLRGGRIEESKLVGVKENIKPKTPTITSVNESNGIFQVTWKSNMEGIVDKNLTAEVTVRKKKGGQEKVFSGIRPNTINKLNIFEIPAADVESSSTYLVRVRSFYNQSGRFSDSSEEFEFTTPISHSSLLLALIISLSVVAGVIAGAAVYCYVKVKKIWDNCPYPNLHIHPYKQEFLKPELSITSSVSVELLLPCDSKSWMKETLSDTHSGNMEQSSGFSTGSSCLSYANSEIPDFTACQHEALRKVFPNISPVSPLPNASNPAAGGLGHAPWGPTTAALEQLSFENKAYLIVNPIFPPPMMSDRSEAPTQMVCVSEYHSVEGEMATCPDQGAPAFPALVFSPALSSSLDILDQPCGADPGLSSCSSGTNTIPSRDPAVEAGGASRGEGAAETTGSKMAAKCDDDPRCGLSAPNSFPLVDDSYLSFQSLVSQPAPEMEECLDKHPVEQIPDSPKGVLSGQCLPEPQRAFFSLLSADQPPAAFTDSGYERV